MLHAVLTAIHSPCSNTYWASTLGFTFWSERVTEKKMVLPALTPIDSSYSLDSWWSAKRNIPAALVSWDDRDWVFQQAKPCLMEIVFRYPAQVFYWTIQFVPTLFLFPSDASEGSIQLLKIKSFLFHAMLRHIGVCSGEKNTLAAWRY